jgi:hypothetical protein
MKPQPHFLLDSKGKPVAVQISISQYEKLLEDLEELEAVKAFDKATKGPLTFEPFSLAVEDIKKERKA